MPASTTVENRDEQYWSRYATTYDQAGEYVVGSAILQAVSGTLSEERDLGHVVEFGCGTGFFTKAIAANAQHIIATDLSDRMLAVARAQLREFENVTVQKSDCARSGLPAGRVDTVLMANLLHVLEMPAPCLAESNRILRDGGLLLVVDLTGYRLGFFASVRLGLRYLRKWGLPPRHGRGELTPEELERMVAGAGFRVEGVQLLRGGSNAIYLRGVKCAKPQSI